MAKSTLRSTGVRTSRRDIGSSGPRSSRSTAPPSRSIPASRPGSTAGATWYSPARILRDRGSDSYLNRSRFVVGVGWLAAAMTSFDGWPPLLELRQYALRPGRRDDLIELFDAEFVESQERLGMGVYGQFRDLDDLDRFVWLRGYPDGSPGRRGEALAAFYGGPVWAQHRKAAQATLLGSGRASLL